jgi:ribosome-associated toxin RatA of RatAB toxin-antitoxin module
VAEQASERIRIDATRERCLEVVLDFERYPDWARDVKQVTILERDEEGRGARVEFRAAGLGKSFRYTLQYDYSELPTAFSWELLEGEGLRRLDGSYRFEPEEDSTRVHYELAVDIAIPLPGLIKRRAAGMIMGTALKELKKAVETPTP